MAAPVSAPCRGPTGGWAVGLAGPCHLPQLMVRRSPAEAATLRRSDRPELPGLNGMRDLCHRKQQLGDVLGPRDHRVMAGRELVIVGNPLGLRGSLAAGRLLADATDVSQRHARGGRYVKVNRLNEGSIRMRNELGNDPSDVLFPH